MLGSNLLALVVSKREPPAPASAVSAMTKAVIRGRCRVRRCDVAIERPGYEAIQDDVRQEGSGELGVTREEGSQQRK